MEIQGLMKDSLDKQDKSKAVDIFQVMADAINKEFVQIILEKFFPTTFEYMRLK